VGSAVAAALIHEAIGDQLARVFVEHSLRRRAEAGQVVDLFRIITTSRWSNSLQNAAIHGQKTPRAA